MWTFHTICTCRVDTLGSLSIVLHSCRSRHFFLNPQDIHLIESNQKLTPNFLQNMKLCILYFSHWFLGSTRAKQGFSMWYRVVHIPKFPNRQLYRSLPNLHVFFYRNVVMYLQHAQRDLARNHSGPTSVKSRKCRRN